MEADGAGRRAPNARIRSVSPRSGVGQAVKCKKCGADGALKSACSRRHRASRAAAGRASSADQAARERLRTSASRRKTTTACSSYRNTLPHRPRCPPPLPIPVPAPRLRREWLPAAAGLSVPGPARFTRRPPGYPYTPPARLPAPDAAQLRAAGLRLPPGPRAMRRHLHQHLRMRRRTRSRPSGLE